MENRQIKRKLESETLTMNLLRTFLSYQTGLSSLPYALTHSLSPLHLPEARSSYDVDGGVNIACGLK